MAGEEEKDAFYRRKEDKDWRLKIDHEQVTTFTAVQVLQDLSKELKHRIRELEITLHGERKNAGLVSEYERHDGLLVKLNSVVFQDSTGKHGLVKDVADLKSGEQAKERRWQSIISIVLALISLAGSLILGWDRISAFLNRKSTDPLARSIERAKHRKGKPIVRYRYVAPPEDDDESSQEVPQGRGGDGGNAK